MSHNTKFGDMVRLAAVISSLFLVFFSCSATDITAGLSKHALHGKLFSALGERYGRLPLEQKIKILEFTVSQQAHDLVHECATALRLGRGRKNQIRSIAYDPHHPGRVACGSADRTLHIVDTAAKTKQRMQGASAGLTSIAYDPHRADRLAAGAHDGTVRLWDTATGAIVRTKGAHAGPGITLVAYDPHFSDRLASGGHDSTVHIWNIATGRCLRTLVGHRAPISSVAYDPHHSGRLASGSDDDTIRVWNTADAGATVQVLRIWGAVLAIAYDPHRPDRLASSSADCITRIWDIAKGEILQIFYLGRINSMAYDPHRVDRLAAISGGLGVYGWDIAAIRGGPEVLRHSQNWTRSIAYDPHCPNKLASGSEDIVNLLRNDIQILKDFVAESRSPSYEQLLMMTLLFRAHASEAELYVADVIADFNSQMDKQDKTSMHEWRRVQSTLPREVLAALNSALRLKARNPSDSHAGCVLL